MTILKGEEFMITMNKKKILSLFILFVLFLGIIYKPFIIKADSGFDSSYDSSSSDDYNNSSSDSYISSSDDYYSGSSNGEYHSFSYESLILIIFIIIIAFICSPITNGINHIDRLFNNIIGYIFYLLFGNIKVRLVTITIIGIYILPKLITVPISFIAGLLSFIIIIVYNVRLLMKGSDFKKLPPKLTNEEIREKIPDLNIQEFNNQVFNIYKEIQIAWMNYNIDSIKNLVSNEIYNMYKMQLETLKVKEQKNIMLNIKYIDNYISNIITDNNTITIKTVLKVTSLCIISLALLTKIKNVITLIY